MLTGTGVKIEDGRTVVLVEAELPDKETYQEASIRGVELLRHLHVAVLQFSLEGKLIYQNPEATNVFGSCSGTFQGMFVDGNIAKSISLSQVAEGNVFDAEVEHHTATGKRWFSTSLRGMRDPVTSQNIVFMIARDISDIVQARKEKAIAQFKSEFMSILSHDIRTPLHQIVGFMDLLEASSNLSKEQKSQIYMVQMSAASFMNMSENILDYSKMNSGRFEIHKVQFNLHRLLDGCIATVVQDAGEKGLRLERNIANDLPHNVIGDPYRLRQILLNLLGNAVKFTERGSVKISASIIGGGNNGPNETAFRCEITDTGIGIETSKQSNVFNKYTQISTTIARNYGGSGLGLAICKTLVGVDGRQD
jgi:signal transduction histidine kinase